MTDYLLKKDKKKKKIVELQIPIKGFHMKPNLKKHDSLISIKDLIIVNEDLKKDLILKQFNRSFRKLITMMINVTESSNSTPKDCAIVLDEASKLRSMIEKKAEKDLKKKEIENLHKKIALVEGKMKNKLLEIRANQMIQTMMQEEIQEEQKSKGR